MFSAHYTLFVVILLILRKWIKTENNLNHTENVIWNKEKETYWSICTIAYWKNMYTIEIKSFNIWWCFALKTTKKVFLQLNSVFHWQQVTCSAAIVLMMAALQRGRTGKTNVAQREGRGRHLTQSCFSLCHSGKKKNNKKAFGGGGGVKTT